MIFATGIVLLVLGFASGALLVLVPLGLIQGTAGITLWLLFPAFTVIGYLMAATPSSTATLPVLSKVSGLLFIVLALVAAVALVLQGGAFIEPRGDTFSLWYVLGIGLVMGAMGLAAHRKPA